MVLYSRFMNIFKHIGIHGMRSSSRLFLPFFLLASLAVAQDSTLEDLQQKAEAGDTGAMVTLAERYATGDGVEQNIRESLRLLREASSAGSGDADFNLGLMYMRGFGVQPDIREAVLWMEKAASKGIVAAQTELGLLYVAGEQVTEDYAKANSYFTKAAEAGDPTAQNNLGWMYLQALGFEKDFQLAEKWFTAAAEQGSMLAQANLGSMFSEELDIQDRVKGHMWLSIAAANGNKATGKKAWLMEVMMSAEQVAEAKRLAEEWLAEHPARSPLPVQ